MKRIWLLLILFLPVIFTFGQHKIDGPVDSLPVVHYIYFKSNSFNPSKSSLRTIDTIEYRIWTECISKVIIEGHTDSTGSDEYNNKLSEKRAIAVSNLIKEVINQRGDTVSQERKEATRLYKESAPQKLKPIGAGKSWPRASNSTAGGRAKNRRVEVSFIPGPCCNTHCSGDTIIYGPNREELIIKPGTYKCPCIEDNIKFAAIVNEEQLRDSANYTALTDDGGPLQSGGMLSIWSRFPDTCFRNCTGDVLLRLPKKFYSCTGKIFYLGVMQNGKVVWHADSTKRFISNGDFYEVNISCSQVERIRINCDKVKPCMCKDCRYAFGGFGFPDNDTYNFPSTEAGIVLQPGDTTVGASIADITSQCFYITNRINNQTGDKTYARYNFAFNLAVHDTDDVNKHLPLGPGKVYLVRKRTAGPPKQRLYEWKADASATGAWIKNPAPPTDVYNDSGCITYTFPVTETGAYMVTDTEMETQPVQMKMRKRFKLTYGFTFTETHQHCPGVMLPVSKNLRRVTVPLTGDTLTRIIYVFEKGGRQYLLDKKISELPKTRNHKYYRIKRKLLETQITKGITQRLQELCRKYMMGSGACSCAKF